MNHDKYSNFEVNQFSGGVHKEHASVTGDDISSLDGIERKRLDWPYWVYMH